MAYPPPPPSNLCTNVGVTAATHNQSKRRNSWQYIGGGHATHYDWTIETTCRTQMKWQHAPLQAQQPQNTTHEQQTLYFYCGNAVPRGARRNYVIVDVRSPNHVPV